MYPQGGCETPGERGGLRAPAAIRLASVAGVAGSRRPRVHTRSGTVARQSPNRRKQEAIAEAGARGRGMWRGVPRDTSPGAVTFVEQRERGAASQHPHLTPTAPAAPFRGPRPTAPSPVSDGGARPLPPRRDPLRRVPLPGSSGIYATQTRRRPDSMSFLDGMWCGKGRCTWPRGGAREKRRIKILHPHPPPPPPFAALLREASVVNSWLNIDIGGNKTGHSPTIGVSRFRAAGLYA